MSYTIDQSTDAAVNAATNTDRITDFTVNIDKIVLRSGEDLFGAAGPPGVLGAARFHIGPAAADASDRVIYNPNTGLLYYDHDGRGGDPQVPFAELTKHLLLDHADFVIGLSLS
jgi:Ca2+-binding RTX toxin-like protein